MIESLRQCPRVLLAILTTIVTCAIASEALAQRATASSDWGPGYSAAQAADGVADENSNYWQTVQGRDKAAWWQMDLGQVVPVEGVKIVWARYEDKVHCAPARVVIQVSPTGAEGSWRDVRKIGAEELPRDGQPYDAEKTWLYRLAQPVPARCVRLLFPEGSQPGAKYPGYLCLGEVEVLAPGLAPRIVAIEDRFGKIEVNVNAPSVVRLQLAGPAGLTAQSLLAQGGPLASGRRRAYTYVVRPDGKRYESPLAKPESVEVGKEAGHAVLRITGVKLCDGDSDRPVAKENWTFTAPGDGAQLHWTISRQWLTEFTPILSGSPGLFFSFNARNVKNSVTSTIWYDPLRIAAQSSAAYAQVVLPRRVSENHLQTVRDRDTWAIYKLWTNWHCAQDLRLEAAGGHLYRRGSYAWLSEAGAVTAAGNVTRRPGEVEQITLKIAAVDKQSTGYQLAVTLPDKATEASLKDFYGSVLNGGAVNDQKGFDWGNETDGWYYAGSCWMYGMALSAGVPASGQMSSHPYDAARAFREHLLHIVSLLDEKGRARFGYNQGGEWVDDNLHTILGAYAYLTHSGDLAFVRQILPSLERMLGYFVQRRNAQGLFQLDDVGAHWYYDAITTSGVNGYYNAFFYKAACDLAEMEAAAGRGDKAREYRTLADSVKTAFNRVFWKEDAPGGPRYIDWIDSQGQPVAYFCDLCQWPPIAVGIASPEQARKIVATADARIKVLEKEHGYQGFASLSALWPVPPRLNPHPWQVFGTYMNGGSLLCQTYWEIVARARAGDAEGAARRLKLFARRAAETSWAGDNAANIKGQMQNGDGEPYLADMVVATAAVVHGVLGVRPSWQRLEASPHLPADWSAATAEVLYKGRRHRVSIEAGKVRIEPLEQVIAMPLEWNVDANFQSTPGGTATTRDVDSGDGSLVQLRKLPAGPGAAVQHAARGLWQSPPWDWCVRAKLRELSVAAELNRGAVTATVETSNDTFRTVDSQVQIAIRDGVQTYPLQPLRNPSRAVRVRFDLTAGDRSATTPVLDAFRIIGEPAERQP